MEQRQPFDSPVISEIGVKLDNLSDSMLKNGAKDSADGVERIKMALNTACSSTGN